VIACVGRWLPVIRQHEEASPAALEVRRLVPDLADELIACWQDDVADILQLPDEALQRLAEDYAGIASTTARQCRSSISPVGRQ
jgi:hypothetical protein